MTWIRPLSAHAPRPCTLVVCRGCCCGDPSKNPGTDHAGQLARLREAAAASGGRLAVRTTDCLGLCAQANVIVVQPTTEARRRGARAAWFGWALDDTATDEIIAWAESGGPGATPVPPTLDLHRIDPRPRSRPHRAPAAAAGGAEARPGAPGAATAPGEPRPHPGRGTVSAEGVREPEALERRNVAFF